MESQAIVGSLVGWGVIGALVLVYFVAVLRQHWRDTRKRQE